MSFDGLMDALGPRLSSKILSLFLAFTLTFGAVKGFSVLGENGRISAGGGGEGEQTVQTGTGIDEGKGDTGGVFSGADAVLLNAESTADSVFVFNKNKMNIIAKKEERKVINCGEMSVFAISILVSRAIDSGRIREDEYAVCPASAQKRPNYVYSSGVLSVGKKMTVKDILKCMIYQKGSSFAYTLAVHISGSEEAFVSELNSLASELDLTATAFTNVCGEEDGVAKTSTYDTAVIISHFLRDQRLKNIFCSNERLTVSEGEAISSVYLTVANDFFVSTCTEGQAKADGVCGGKVGAYGEKRFSVVLFTKEENEYVIITVGSVSPYSESLKIFAKYL